MKSLTCLKITEKHHQALGEQMKKSGKTNRAEPTELNWIDKIPGSAELFENAGWLNFFKKIDGYNIKVSHKFAQCYNKDIVSVDTLKFKLTTDLVAEATGVKMKEKFGLRKCHLLSMHKGIYCLILFQIGARECPSIISELNG